MKNVCSNLNQEEDMNNCLKITKAILDNEENNLENVSPSDFCEKNGFVDKNQKVLAVYRGKVEPKQTETEQKREKKLLSIIRMIIVCISKFLKKYFGFDIVDDVVSLVKVESPEFFDDILTFIQNWIKKLFNFIFSIFKKIWTIISNCFRYITSILNDEEEEEESHQESDGVQNTANTNL